VAALSRYIRGDFIKKETKGDNVAARPGFVPRDVRHESLPKPAYDGLSRLQGSQEPTGLI